jgi:hypothetical protein
MDKSETYIKMCEKATEIKNDHEWDNGDWAYWPKNGDVYPLCDNRENSVQEQGSMGYVWLPRQDQLQEIVCDKFRLQMPGFMVNDLNCWNAHIEWHKITSMEQLWLAFVMSKKHQKQWNGEDWIKEI